MQETGKWSYKINKLEGGNKIKKKKNKKMNIYNEFKKCNCSFF